MSTVTVIDIDRETALDTYRVAAKDIIDILFEAWESDDPRFLAPEQQRLRLALYCAAESFRESLG